MLFSGAQQSELCWQLFWLSFKYVCIYVCVHIYAYIRFFSHLFHFKSRINVVFYWSIPRGLAPFFEFYLSLCNICFICLWQCMGGGQVGGLYIYLGDFSRKTLGNKHKLLGWTQHTTARLDFQVAAEPPLFWVLFMLPHFQNQWWPFAAPQWHSDPSAQLSSNSASPHLTWDR